MIVAPRPESGRPWNEIYDSGHTVVFGCLACLLLYRLRRGGRPASLSARYLVSLAVAVGAGALTEAMQIAGPRDADWGDLLRDTAGASSFLLLVFAFELRPQPKVVWMRVGIGLFTAVLLAVGLHPVLLLAARDVERGRAFPVIAGFDSGLEARFLEFRDAELERVPRPREGDPGNRAGRVRFEPGHYPALIVPDPPPDWRGYDALSFGVRSDRDSAVVLILRIEDDAHDGTYHDRFNRKWIVHPGETRFRIPLSEIAEAPRTRTLDLSRIRALTLFTVSPSAPFSLEFDDLRLVRDGGGEPTPPARVN